MEDTTKNVLYDHIMKVNNDEINDERLVSLQRKINELSAQYNDIYVEIYDWMNGSFFKISRESETPIVSYAKMIMCSFDDKEVTLYMSGYSVDTDNQTKPLGRYDVFIDFVVKLKLFEFKGCEVVQISREEFMENFKKLNHESVEEKDYNDILEL